MKKRLAKQNLESTDSRGNSKNSPELRIAEDEKLTIEQVHFAQMLGRLFAKRWIEQHQNLSELAN